MDHQIVKKSLNQFIKQHIPKADLKIVDDIVLQYVVSILEEASEDPCFDVEGKLVGLVTIFINKQI